MKKIILITVLAVFCFMANAQDEPSNGTDIKFGLKAGINFAMIAGDDSDNFDGKFGFHAGAVVEFPISETFSVQPELVYSSQGDKETSEGMDIKYNLDYLNLPIMAKYYFTEEFSVEAGPQIGFLLSGEVKGGGVSIDIKDVLKDIDFGIGFGLGYKLENGLNFSGRFNVGISNIVDNSGSILGEQIDFADSTNQNNVFQLSIGYNF